MSPFNSCGLVMIETGDAAKAGMEATIIRSMDANPQYWVGYVVKFADERGRIISRDYFGETFGNLLEASDRFGVVRRNADQPETHEERQIAALATELYKAKWKGEKEAAQKRAAWLAECSKKV